MQSISFYLKNPRTVFNAILYYFFRWLPDATYLRLLFYFNMGKRLNLRSPKTFSEKLQWLKLYDHNPKYCVMVDKVKAKDYVASILGKEFIIPTIGVWDDPDKIDFNFLPDRFVLKCNHNSGTGMFICKDKSNIDEEKVRAGLRKGLKENYFSGNREWPYKSVPHLVLAEQYLEPDPKTDDLLDYKFFCFNGEPKYCQVISGRNKHMCIDFFDEDWNHQPFHEPRNFPFAETKPQQPDNFTLMWNMARKLANEIPFCRIDFYDVDNHVYFGEITFFPTSGIGGFDPGEYDYSIGSMLTLPNIDSVKE